MWMVSMSQGNTLPAFGWALLHDQRFFTWHHEMFLVGYPLIPFIAITPLGYCLGQLYTSRYDAEKRVKMLITIGASALVLFIVLRYSNLYGDPVKWSEQKNAFFTFLFLYQCKQVPFVIICFAYRICCPSVPCFYREAAKWCGKCRFSLWQSANVLLPHPYLHYSFNCANGLGNDTRTGLAYLVIKNTNMVYNGP